MCYIMQLLDWSLIHLTKHHCELYSLLNGMSLHIRWELQWCIFIYKILLGLLPKYLQDLLQHHIQPDHLIIFFWLSLEIKLLMVVLLFFGFAASNNWYVLQKSLKLEKYISISAFKKKKKNSRKCFIIACKCFEWMYVCV